MVNDEFDSILLERGYSEAKDIVDFYGKDWAMYHALHEQCTSTVLNLIAKAYPDESAENIYLYADDLGMTANQVQLSYGITEMKAT